MNTDYTDYTDKGSDTGISVLSVLSVFVLNDHGIGDFYSLMCLVFEHGLHGLHGLFFWGRGFSFDSVMRWVLNTDCTDYTDKPLMIGELWYL